MKRTERTDESFGEGSVIIWAAVLAATLVMLAIMSGRAAASHDCRQQVCFVDPYCCAVEWDNVCEAESRTICDIALYPTPTPTNSPLPSNTPTATPVSSCVKKICSADPYCCQTAWDQICISEVASICGLQCGTSCCGNGTCNINENNCTCPGDCEASTTPCGCAHSTCVEGVALRPGCDDRNGTFLCFPR